MTDTLRSRRVHPVANDPTEKPASPRCGRHPRRTGRRTSRPLLLESLEDRTLLSTIVWTNRGVTSGASSDNFNQVFGSLAGQARAVIDADIAAWQRVIGNFNYADGTDTYNLTISMNTTAITTPGTSVGANSGPTGFISGKPSAGSVGIGWRNIAANGNSADGWFLDPSPGESSEFQGTLNNAFSQTPTSSLGGGDLFTAVEHELGHCFGLLAGGLITGLSTNTGVTDTINAPASSPVSTYWLFNGPSVKTLWTSWDSGGAGSGGATNANGAQHAAPLGASYTVGGTTYYGAVDLMNAYFTSRSIISDNDALMLRDAYGYSITNPSSFGTMYDTLDADGTLRITCPSGAIGDALDISTFGETLFVSMKLGSPVKGIDPVGYFTSDFSALKVSSIQITTQGGGSAISFHDIQGLSAGTAIHITSNGTDTVEIRDLPTGTTAHITSNDDDTIDLGDDIAGAPSIQGAVTIKGSGFDALRVNDQYDTAPGVTWTFTGSRISNSYSGSGAIDYAGVSRVIFNGGSGVGATDDVESTTADTTLNTGTGTINVSPTAKNLDALGGALTVHGGGATALVVDDQDANPLLPIVTDDTLTGTALTRFVESINPFTGIPTFHTTAITYGGLASLTLYTGATLNLVHVESTSAATTVNAGPGNALVDVSPTAKNLDALGGALTVHGGGLTALIIDDQGNPAVFPGSLTQDTLTGTALTRFVQAINPSTGLPSFHTTTITYSGLAGVTLNTGYALTLVHVLGTSTATTLNAGSGTALVNVSPGNLNLDTLGGALTVHGVGATALIVDDQNHVASTTYTMAAGRIQRNGSAPITYSGVNGVGVNGGNGADTYKVLGTTAGVTTSVSGGTGVNTLIGPNVASTWNLTGTNAGTLGTISFSRVANLTGGTGADTFKFTSAGNLTGRVDGGAGANVLDYSGDGGIAATVNLATATAFKTDGFANIEKLVGSSSAADTLIGLNAANTWTISAANAGTVGPFSFSAVEKLTGGTGADAFKFTTGSVTGKIDGGTGTDTLDYSGDGGTAATISLATLTATRTGGFANIEKLVGSTSTADKLIGPNATNIWSITAANAGTVAAFGFSGVENLTGGNGADEFVFSAGKTVSGKIDGGGGGNDWLDYATYSTPVSVNLTANTATGVAGGIANIRNVRGGQGGNTLTGNSRGNILVGGNGVDTLTGGSGRSILIGGKGNDVVKGGSADDIVIGGYTDYDSSSNAHDQALTSILAEWQSANSYATRIAHIKSGGGLNGSNKLILGTSVHDDGNSNRLTGNGGTDWFFKGAKDTITDRALGEIIN